MTRGYISDALFYTRFCLWRRLVANKKGPAIARPFILSNRTYGLAINPSVHCVHVFFDPLFCNILGVFFVTADTQDPIVYNCWV